MAGDYREWFREFRNVDSSAFPPGVHMPEANIGAWAAIQATGCGTPCATGYAQSEERARMVDECHVLPRDWRRVQSILATLRWIATGFWPAQTGYLWGDGTGANAVQSWSYPIISAGLDEETGQYYVECTVNPALPPTNLTWNGAFVAGEEGIEQQFFQVCPGPGWQISFSGGCSTSILLLHHVEHASGESTCRFWTLGNCLGAASRAVGDPQPWATLTYWAPDFLPGWLHPRDAEIMYCVPWARDLRRSDLDSDGRGELLGPSGESVRIAPAEWGAELFRATFSGASDLYGDQTALVSDRIGIVQDPATGTWQTFLHLGSLLPDGTTGDDLRVRGWSACRAIYFADVGGAAEGGKVCVPGRCSYCRRDYTDGVFEPTAGANGVADDDTRWFCDARGAVTTPTGLARFLAKRCWQMGTCSSFAVGEHWLRGSDMSRLLREMRGSVDIAEEQIAQGFPAQKFVRLGPSGLHVLTSPASFFSSPPTAPRRTFEILDPGPFVDPTSPIATDDEGNQTIDYRVGGVYTEDFDAGFFADEDPEIGSLQSSAQPALMDDDDDPGGGRRAWPNRLWPRIGQEAAGVRCADSGRGEPLVQRIGFLDGRHNLVVCPDVFSVDADGLNGWPAIEDHADDPGGVIWQLERFDVSGGAATAGGVVMGARLDLRGPTRREDLSIFKTTAEIASITDNGDGTFEVQLANKQNAGARSYWSYLGGGASIIRETFRMGGGTVGPPDARRLNNYYNAGSWRWWGTPEQAASPGDVIRFTDSGIALDDLGAGTTMDNIRFWITKAEAFAGDAEPWTGSDAKTAEGQVAGFLDHSGEPALTGWPRDHIQMRISGDDEDIPGIDSEERPIIGPDKTHYLWWFDPDKAALIYNQAFMSKTVTVTFVNDDGDDYVYHYVLNYYPRLPLPETPLSIESVSYSVGGDPITVLTGPLVDILKGQCRYFEFEGDRWLQFAWDDTAFGVTVEFTVTPPGDAPPDVEGKPEGWNDYANRRDVLTVLDEQGLLSTHGAALAGKAISIEQNGQIGPVAPITVYLGPNALDVRQVAYDITADVEVMRADGTIYIPAATLAALDLSGESYCLAVETDVANRRGHLGARQVLSLIDQVDACRTLRVGGSVGIAGESWATIWQSVGPTVFDAYDNDLGTPTRWDAPGLPGAGECVPGMKWGDFEGVDFWNCLLLNWRRKLPVPSGGWPDGLDHYWAEKTVALGTRYDAVAYYSGAIPPTDQPFIDPALVPTLPGQVYDQGALCHGGDGYMRNSDDGVPSTLPDGWPEWWGQPGGPGNPAVGGTGFWTASAPGVSNSGLALDGPSCYAPFTSRGAGWYSPSFRMNLGDRLRRMPDDATIESFRYAVSASGAATVNTAWWERGDPEYADDGTFTSAWVKNGFTFGVGSYPITEMGFDFFYIDQEGNYHWAGMSSLTVPLDGKTRVIDDPAMLETILALRGGLELDGGKRIAVTEIVAIPAIDTAGLHPGEQPTPGTMMGYLDKYTHADLKAVSWNRKPFATRGLIGKWWLCAVNLSTSFTLSVEFLDATFRLGDRWIDQPCDYEAFPRMDVLT